MTEDREERELCGKALWRIEDRLDPDGRVWLDLSEREREHYRIMAEEFTRFLRSRLIAGDDVVSGHSE